MAVTDPYCSVALYRQIVTKSDAGDDAVILGDLRAVSRLVDRWTGRFFGKDDSAVARVYEVPTDPNQAYRDPFFVTPWNAPAASRPLEVDDIATTAGLLIRADTNQDGTFPGPDWATTDYLLEPTNAALGAEPGPYTRIVLPSWSTQSLLGGQRVRVTAVWGWPAVPDAVVRATAHLTGILRLESPRATSRVDEMGQTLMTSREAQTIVRDLVKAYKRRALVFA